MINQLAAREPELQAEFVCDRAFESQARGLMEHAAVPVTVRTIAAGKFRRYKHLTFLQHFTVPAVVFGNLRDTMRIAHGFLQSLWILLTNRPDVVFAKGGYVCLPMGLAAWVLRVPLVIHDSDTRPGLTNRILSRFARVIATGSPLENYPYKQAISHYVGVPIGDGFEPVTAERQAALKQQLGFAADQKLVVATGGGLGAKSINDAMVRIAPALSMAGIAVYVVTGKKHYDAIAQQLAGLDNIIATPFVYEGMADVLGAADVVVARGSATFLQELAGLQKAVVVVPAKQLGDQLKNAAMYETADAALVVKDSPELGDNDGFADQVIALMDNDVERQKLAKNLHTFARPNAARDLATLILGQVAMKK